MHAQDKETVTNVCITIIISICTIHYSVTSGPFLIKHTQSRTDDFFVKVSKENEVQLTRKRDEAHPFYIRRVSEYSDYFEIIDSSQKGKLHFTATVNWRGYGVHPPKLRSDANGRSYMAIYDRESRPKDMKLEDPRKCGKNENDAFFISCYTKPAFSKDACYLIVNRKVKWPWSSDTDLEYWIGCAPSIKHNRQDGEPMLFKLVSQEEEHEATTPSRVADDGEPAEETDGGSIHIEVMAEMHP